MSAEDLTAIREIETLKSRYCRFVDLKQWRRLPELFTDDARFEGFGAAPDGATLAEFVSGIERRLGGAVTVHHCHQPEIRLLPPDAAKAVWAMMDFNEWPHTIDLAGYSDASGFMGFGFYQDRYRRVNGAWRISFMRLTRIRVDPLRPAREARERFPFDRPFVHRRPDVDWLTDPD